MHSSQPAAYMSGRYHLKYGICEINGHKHVRFVLTSRVEVPLYSSLQLLVASVSIALSFQDPHFSGSADIDYLQRHGWIAWKDEEFFLTESFYNFCIPQCGPSDVT